MTLRVDSTHNYTNTPGSGRPSVRLESKEAYTHGLFIADFAHMPPGQCGVWPACRSTVFVRIPETKELTARAVWMYGPNWPNSGEIDIIEGANTATKNLMSGHT